MSSMSSRSTLSVLTAVAAFASLSACGGSTSPGNGASADSGAAHAVCDPRAADGIRIAGAQPGPNPLDPLGYPPYALDACTLVYVAAGATAGTAGELRTKDLATSRESALAAASEAPRRPSIAGGVVAWEATLGGASVIRVSVGAKPAITLSGAFDHAAEPRATEGAVVFTGWLTPDTNGDTDVFVFSAATGTVTAVATGPGQQRFADISADLVAVSDFSEDASGYFDANRLSLSDIVVFDRRTLAKTVRHAPGKQAFPLLGVGGKLVYQDWGIVHPEPKMSIWSLMVGDVFGLASADVNAKGSGQVQTNAPYVRPSVRGGELEWVDDTSGTSALFRRPLDLSTPAAKASDAASFYSAVAGDSVTLVSTLANGAYELRGVAR